jgi:hypothetical protein
MSADVQHKRFDSFAEFYPFYLEEHSHPACRRLHYLGSLLVLALLAYVLATRTWVLGSNRAVKWRSAGGSSTIR